MSFIKKIINNGNVELYKYDGEEHDHANLRL